jgi:glyoxalase-like protein
VTGSSRQIPPPGELTLDHLAYFVSHVEAASTALEKLGFTLTPLSAQSHRLEPGGPLVPAGTANRCVMLERGYLEFLTPIGDTSVAAQLRTAIKRYVGVHSIVFGTSAPDADYARLEKAAFGPLAPIALQREIDTPHGAQTARFTVVRTPPGTMAEGRIQFCQHHTPQWVWQERWVAHPNLAVGLNGVLICTPDPAEAARRYTRYTGLLAQVSGSVWRVDTARGYLLVVDPKTLRRRLDLEPPSLPWLAGFFLESDDIDATGEYLRRNDASVHVLGSQRLLVKLPPDLGGMIIFEARDTGHLNFD